MQDAGERPPGPARGGGSAAYGLARNFASDSHLSSTLTSAGRPSPAAAAEQPPQQHAHLTQAGSRARPSAGGAANPFVKSIYQSPKRKRGAFDGLAVSSPAQAAGLNRQASIAVAARDKRLKELQS
jgi:hypothetical protein